MEICTSRRLVIRSQYDVLDFLYCILLGTVSDKSAACSAMLAALSAFDGLHVLGGRFHPSRRVPPLRSPFADLGPREFLAMYLPIANAAQRVRRPAISLSFPQGTVKHELSHVWACRRTQLLIAGSQRLSLLISSLACVERCCQSRIRGAC